jgi:hypothetical protein
MRNAARQCAAAGYIPDAGDSGRIDPQWAGPNLKDAGALMIAHSNFASIGAIGPDLFFFLPDFRNFHGIPLSSFLVQVLNFLEKLYGDIDPYIAKYEKYLGPIGEDTGEELSRLTGGLTESIGNITGDLSQILITALENWITSQNDWWAYFSLGLNKGPDDQDYMWSDIFHYRSTGDFSRRLWLNANALDDDTLRAYALGFVTHVATDVTGHAFVNEIVGGPFRLHWQRHHLTENHMDSFWYVLDPDAGAPVKSNGYDQFTSSALYYDIAFQEGSGDVIPRPNAPTGRTMRETWTRKRMLDQDSALPGDVANLLVQTIEDVFYTGAVPHPRILATNDGRPDAEMIGNAYDLLYRFLKFTTVDGLYHEPPDPPKVFPNLDFPTPTDPGDKGGGGDGGGGGGGHHHSFWDDLLDFVLAVARAIAYVAEVAVYLATLPWAILADLGTYPLRYALYYLLELPLYHMLKGFRAVLVLTGYVMPMKDEIAPNLIHIGVGADLTFDQIVAQMGDVFGDVNAGEAQGLGRTRFVDAQYPRRHPGDEYRHPWHYPDTESAELGYENLTGTNDARVRARLGIAGPYPQNAEPEILFGGDAGNANTRAGLEGAQTPEDTSKLTQSVGPHDHLGDPVSFCKYLLWLTTRSGVDGNKRPIDVPMTNWNLDADRGYAYHDWDWNRDPSQSSSDEQGHSYVSPCVWPSQADNAAAADVPVQLHYVPGADPHCEPYPP